MIKSIRLQNWKTHLDSTFEFVRGTNVIVGHMGSGKSSLMDAISFALYGTFPSQAARKVSLEETIMAKPIKQEKGTVTLSFEYAGKDYEVERTVKRNGISEAYLREGTRIISGPKMTEVTKKIEETLEATYDLFSRAIYSEQNQIDYFLKLSAAQRKEKLDELLGLDKYERVRANSVTLSNRLRKTADDRKAFLAEQKKKVDPKSLAEYEKRALEKKHELGKNAEELARLQEEGKAATARLKAMEEKQKLHNKLHEALITAKSRQESLSEQLAKLKRKLDRTGHEKAKESIAETEKKLALLTHLKKELATEKEHAEKDIAIAREGLAVQKNTLENAGKSLRNAETISGKCPVCKRPMDKHDREKLGEELEEESEKARKSIAELEKKLSAAQKNARELQEKTGKLDAEKETMQGSLLELRHAMEATEEAERCKKQLEELDAKTNETNAQIRKLGFDENGLAKERAAFYSVSERTAKLKSELKAAEELLKEIESSAKIMREAGERVKTLEGQVAATEKALEKLAIFASALRSTQAEMRGAMIQTINEAMDEIWPNVYPYEDFTSVRISVEEGSYEIMVRQLNGEWVRVDGILSGGERSAAALTIRIATSLVLTQNLGWIILDEPTHNLDANAVKELAGMLGGRLPALIEQVFIITHDKEMENAASGKLYVLEREKSKDGVTKVVSE
ncbi:MAG: AAA family ATPase [Candidatus Diapherotrites archaeon]|uniref:AAA family ATPase n=1 Tax=Candidatus Iainarchaeum sp. TaxID=3101447 RepID=A0A8T3YLG7_9ARCH|nr:AAA family ATPase [Candidatus Diapherotrites archaeon]